MAMVMKEHTTKVTTQLFQENLAVTILYIVKYRKLVSVVMPNNFLVTMPTWKPSAKFSIYVPTIKLMIFSVQTEQSSINNSSSVYGGISLIVIPHQTFSI